MNYLRQAFDAGRSAAIFAENTYNHAGFMVMRVMIDDSFLDIDDKKIASPRLKKAANIYNTLNNVAQDKLLKSVSETFASGNVGPKPDFKKPILSVGGVIFNNVTRMSVAQTAVLALSVGVGLVAMHIGSQEHMATALPDTMGTYLSLKPNSGVAPSAVIA